MIAIPVTKQIDIILQKTNKRTKVFFTVDIYQYRTLVTRVSIFLSKVVTKLSLNPINENILVFKASAEGVIAKMRYPNKKIQNNRYSAQHKPLPLYNYCFIQFGNPLVSVPKFCLSLFTELGGSGQAIENETIQTPIAIATKLANATMAKNSSSLCSLAYHFIPKHFRLVPMSYLLASSEMVLFRSTNIQQ